MSPLVLNAHVIHGALGFRVGVILARISVGTRKASLRVRVNVDEDRHRSVAACLLRKIVIVVKISRILTPYTCTQ